MVCLPFVVWVSPHSSSSPPSSYKPLNGNRRQSRFLPLSPAVFFHCQGLQLRAREGERVSMSVSPPCFPPSCCLGEHKAIIETLLTFSPFDWTSPKGCRYPRTLFKSLPPGQGLQARLALFLSVVQVLQRGRWAAGTFVSVNLNIPPTTSCRADAWAFQRQRGLQRALGVPPLQREERGSWRWEQWEPGAL